MSKSSQCSPTNQARHKFLAKHTLPATNCAQRTTILNDRLHQKSKRATTKLHLDRQE